jgi:hypothetical protein
MGEAESDDGNQFRESFDMWFGKGSDIGVMANGFALCRWTLRAVCEPCGFRGMLIDRAIVSSTMKRSSDQQPLTLELAESHWASVSVVQSSKSLPALAGSAHFAVRISGALSPIA